MLNVGELKSNDLMGSVVPKIFTFIEINVIKLCNCAITYNCTTSVTEINICIHVNKTISVQIRIRYIERRSNQPFSLIERL